jgi:predicted RNase H-like nuclease (RuvC/YqgF family)
MMSRNPFKKIVLELESSLNLIEEEISLIPDSFLGDSNNLMNEVMSSLVDKCLQKKEKHNSNKKTTQEEEKIEALDSQLETIRSKINSAHETFLIPYEYTKLSALDENAQEVEWITRSIFSLMQRLDKLQYKLREKNSFIDPNVSLKVKNKKSWGDVTDINI